MTLVPPDAQPSTEKAPVAAKIAASLGVAAFFVAAGLLWWTQGSKVFLDALAAGFAWCF